MKRANRQLAWLALGVAALGAVVYAEIARERAALPPPLTAIDPARVQHLAIECQSVCRSRRFERTANGWQMLEPYAKPASAEAVAHLLAVARAPVRVTLERSAYDAAKLGLAPPLLVLRVDDVAIALGDEDPIEHDRYVLVGDTLARVPDRFSARLFEAPENELAETPPQP
jgi:hypothetical protein